ADEFDSLDDPVQEIFSLNYDDLSKELDAIKGKKGAIPTEEYSKGLVIKFQRYFTNFSEAIKWATSVLEDSVVTSTDGSQIFPTPDISIPVGLVQVAVYKNEHSINRSYKKDVLIRGLSPLELEILGSDANLFEFSESVVSAARFDLEISTLIEEMESISQMEPKEKNAYFISDGSLILSFVQRLDKSIAIQHINTLMAGLDKSASLKYPLIGYVDTSVAKDVIFMINKLRGPGPMNIKYLSDSKILEYYISRYSLKRNLFPGDRTCTFICDRDDPVYNKFYASKDKKIAFFYIKLNSERMARVEFPAWCVGEEGLIEKIANMILAQALIGAGYPYVIDQCHHKCIITNEDKEKFYRLLQYFANENGIPFRIRNKARSKRRRYYTPF
ncbi:MAG: DNA double-strand break repair nuclease NurA, partial [Promethearchaeota archaeon]